MRILTETKLTVKIKGFQGTSLIDYPGKVAAIIFTGGCNFRCPFCHNPELVVGDLPDIPLEKILSELERRRGFIEAVSITGGEPFIFRDIHLFTEMIKERGFSVKIDTNGSFPERLKKVLDNESVDFVAMDVKSSFDNYPVAAGVKVDVEKIAESIEMIKEWDGESEFRVTVVPKIVGEDDIVKLASILKGSKKVVLQQFRNRVTLDPDFRKLYPYSPDVILHFAKILEGEGINVEVRGI